MSTSNRNITIEKVMFESERTGWFPSRVFERLRLRNHPTAANKEVVSILLLPQFPLLTQEGKRLPQHSR
jgi:hypothetical protein